MTKIRGIREKACENKLKEVEVAKRNTRNIKEKVKKDAVKKR